MRAASEQKRVSKQEKWAKGHRTGQEYCRDCKGIAGRDNRQERKGKRKGKDV